MTTEREADSNEIMCPCSGTRRNQIRDLFLQGKDIEAISRWTGAISGCGGCEWDIEVFLGELAKDLNQQGLDGKPTPSSE